MFCGSLSLRVLCIAVCLAAVTATLSPPDQKTAFEKKLSRRKRFLAFPEGSSVSAAICLTIGVIGNPEINYLSWAENWGVAYNLPNYTFARQHAAGFKSGDKSEKPTAQRRSRRDLYEKIEVALETLGFDGPACIGRALCESARYFSGYTRRKRGTMIEEIVKKVFSLPTEPALRSEAAAVHHYDRIYRRAHRDVHDCKAEYETCHFSLLDLTLGKYYGPPVNHGFDSIKRF